MSQNNVTGKAKPPRAHSPMLHYVKKTMWVDQKSRSGVVYRVPKFFYLPKSLEADYEAKQAAGK